MKKSAVTLVELVVVIVIVSILSVGLGSFIKQAMDVWNFTTFRGDTVNDARMAVLRMTRDLRGISLLYSGIKADTNQTVITYVSGAATNRYRYDTSVPANNRLYYEEDAAGDGTFEASNILLAGLANFSLRYYNSSGYDITTEVAGGTFSPIHMIGINVTVGDSITKGTFSVSNLVFPRN